MEMMHKRLKNGRSGAAVQCLEHPWIKVGGTAPKSSMTKNIMTGIQKLMQMNDLHKVPPRPPPTRPYTLDHH